MTNSSGYDGLSSDAADVSESTLAYKSIVKFPLKFDPFYDSASIGEGTFGKVFKARIREGFLVTIPKVRVRLPHCIPVHSPVQRIHSLPTRRSGRHATTMKRLTK